MSKVAIVAALEREVSGFTRICRRVTQEYEGRTFTSFERDDMVIVCGGIGMESARRAAETVIAFYSPTLLQSVGFAGALDASLHVGDLFTPAVVIDARDGGRVEIPGGDKRSMLVSFMAVAGVEQKRNLATAYGAQVVDMEAAGVAAAARAHDIAFGVAKVISDDWNFEMPQMGRFIDAQGRFKTAPFVLFVALRPWLWRRVARLASNSRKAARVLGEHLERLRMELSQLADHPAAAATSTPQAAAGGLRTRGHQ
jgi:adenosylhomocysteine nucleosidase